MTLLAEYTTTTPQLRLFGSLLRPYWSLSLTISNYTLSSATRVKIRTI